MQFCYTSLDDNFYLYSVPVTYAWRDELEKKTHNAISKALGQNPLSVHYESHSVIGKQKTNKLEFDSMEDDQVRCHVYN